MARDNSKFSLVAQFDDICRHCSTNTEPDTADEELLLEFVRSREECRKRWHASVAENTELKKLTASLTATNMELEQKLANAREVLRQELLRREKCEDEVKAQQRQLELVRGFLANATGLPDKTAERLSILVPDDAGKLDDQGSRLSDESVGSALLSPLGDSFDISDNGYRGASTPGPSQGKSLHSTFFGSASPVAKKFKVQDEMEASGESAVHKSVITMNGKELAESSQVVTMPPVPPHCASLPLPRSSPAVEKCRAYVPTTPKSTSGSAPSTPVAQRQAHAALSASIPKRSSSVEKLLTRPHNFVTRTVFRADSTCGPCGKRIRFCTTISKCNRCQSICHPQCKYRVPLPCIAPSLMPKRRCRRPLISDYAPPTPPMVPALVVHCIQEVECRGLDAVGIYRLPGAEGEVREIREKFQPGKGVPDLSKADIHAVCSTLKDFLHSLSETLVTKSLWQTFVEATKLEGEDQVWSTWQAVSQLPRPNRDTLALLVLHLQMVAAHPKANMPTPNLVRVFAPTVVGFSVDRATPAPSMLGEVEQQHQILFLNKLDLFREKIIYSDWHLRYCMPDYKGADHDVDTGALFIQHKFQSRNRDPGKVVYPHFTTATDTSNVQVVFQVAMDTVLRGNLRTATLL